MHTDVVWLTAVLLSFPLLTLCDPLYIFTAPQIMKVGIKDRVFVEVQDYTGTDTLDVFITVNNFPSNQLELTHAQIKLNTENRYHALVDLEIPLDNRAFNLESQTKEQYVYLKARWSNGKSLEKLVLVSFQLGYLYVFTDKPIYTPESIVNYRIFSLNPDAMPLSKYIIVNIVNPDDIIVENKQLKVEDGVASDKYKLPDPIPNGIWKIAATFTDNLLKNFTTEFEVKEYRLPSFDIKLNPKQAFFYVDDEEFTVDIEASYLFGKKVEGSAFVVFGVDCGTNERTSIKSSLKRVSIIKGKGTAVLRRENLIDTFSDVKKLVGKTLYMSVSILTDTGSEMVEAERRGIHIVTSPYTILFTKTPKFYKPGMPFYFMVYVTNPDGTPADNVELLAKVADDQYPGRTTANGIAKFSINTNENVISYDITVLTNIPKLGKPAEKMITVHAYKSQTIIKRLLNIKINKEITVGKTENFEMTLKSDSPGDREVTFMVLSKGQIVKASKLKRSSSFTLTQTLDITKDMLPSFRIVAYYHVGNSEVVSDSVWVDVEDSCIGTLKVKAKDPRPAYDPGVPIELELTGDPGAKVYLVAVDEGVYVLNNKNRLTQKKIWDVIESHDTGCTAGSGENAMGVFYDAGLMFTTDGNESTKDRIASRCQPASKRRRRTASKAQITNTLVNKYDNPVRKCCRDGLVKNLLGYTCERRSKYILDGEACRKAFLDCCSQLATMEEDVVEGELHFARTEEEDIDDNMLEIQSRSNFPETWMWKVVNLPPSAERVSTAIYREGSSPESITNWVITAISMSQDKGICVAEPFDYLVKQDFFIDLKLPYSAVVNEQIEIKAVIHNLGKTELKTVYVDFLETDYICSKASNDKKKYRTTVKIDADSSRSVSFIIIPLKSGRFEIEVKAYSNQPQRSDGIKKTLKVVPPGVLTSTGEVTIILEPEKKGGQQRSEIKRPYLGNQVPGTDAQTYITVRGTPMPQMVNDAISGVGLDSFMREPYGCGEQNLLAMVLPLVATVYLDKTNQWEDIGVDKRSQGIQYINTGYTTELKFRKPDGGFAVWEYSESNTWLTAYVVRMFSKASNLITIKADVICDAVKWLILKTQNPDGSFAEIGYRITSSAMQGKSSSISMTAFVLIALQAANDNCLDRVSSLSNSIRKATDYLANNMGSVSEPYAATMASYALANANKLNRDVLFRFASADKTHWPVYSWNVMSTTFTLEATGYALLALLKVKDLSAAEPIAKWLKSNQRYEGGYSSTQATAVVFEAIAKYLAEKPTVPDGDMLVSVDSNAKAGLSFKNIFNKKSRQQRSDKFPATGDLTVTASGRGEGILAVRTLYYAKPVENATKCTSFELKVTMKKQKVSSRPVPTFILTIETKYLKNKPAPMTILDIGMLTGFEPDTTDLDKLMGSDKYIERYENTNSTFSERGSLIIYLGKVSNENTDTVAFRLYQTLNVGESQPAGITVYEYYDPANKCIKFYSPQMNTTSGSLNLICPTEVCSCAEANCAIQKWPEVPAELNRNDEACKNKDYAYKATLEMIETRENTVIYTFIILEVLIPGTDPVVKDEDRDFIAHSRCKTRLNLKEQKNYLIMGSRPVEVKDSFHYLLDSTTWIEYWPTQEESQEDKNNNRKRYIGLQGLKDMLEDGCGV